MLNELHARGGRVRSRKHDSASYAHADNGICNAARERGRRPPKLACNEAMTRLATAREVGFEAPEQGEADFATIGDARARAGRPPGEDARGLPSPEDGRASGALRLER